MGVRVTAFLGYGPLSEGVRRNVLALVEKMREIGIDVDYGEVRVPAVDLDEFEPFVKIDEREVYIPSVEVDADKLVEYVLAYAVVEAMRGFLPPPLEAPIA